MLKAINFKDGIGWSGLHGAVSSGHLNIVQFLLSLPHLDVNTVTPHTIDCIRYKVNWGKYRQAEWYKELKSRATTKKPHV